MVIQGVGIDDENPNAKVVMDLVESKLTTSFTVSRYE